MTAKPRRPGTWKEKPSEFGQWQERPDYPTIADPMDKAQMDEHRAALVASYGCAPDDITYGFTRILDENDADRDDCLLLQYKMKCGHTERIIFTLKIPMPAHVRKQAELQQQERARVQKAMRSKRIAGVPPSS